MTDPRFTDPRYSDPQVSDPVIRRDESVGGMWGWIAGIAVLLLIGFLVVAGRNNDSNIGTSGSATSTTAQTPARTVVPPSTTGSGTLSSQPFTAVPSNTPASPPNGTQQ